MHLLGRGSPANTVVNYATLAPTTVSIANVNLPKFNPAIGNLGCVSLVDTITAVSITHVWNKAASKTKYKFQLQLNNDIEGPGGLSATSSFSKFYGPDSLEAAGLPGDSITYGPDSLYVNNIDSNGTTNTVRLPGNRRHRGFHVYHQRRVDLDRGEHELRGQHHHRILRLFQAHLLLVSDDHLIYFDRELYGIPQRQCLFIDLIRRPTNKIIPFMRSRPAPTVSTSPMPDSNRVALLQKVLLQHTNINTTPIRLIWATSISASK